MQEYVRRNQIGLLGVVARSAYALGDLAASEKAARQSLALWETTVRFAILDDLNRHQTNMNLALAIVREGHLKEADAIIQPVLRFHREIDARRSDFLPQKVELSRALLISSLAAPRERGAQLAEAAAIMESLPHAMKRGIINARLRAEIAEEQKKRP